MAILRTAQGAVRAAALHLDVSDAVREGAARRASPSWASASPTPCSACSDHSLGNYTCFAAVALGASILEKHFTSDKTWPGPDVSDLDRPARARRAGRGHPRRSSRRSAARKEILPEEQPTIDFAYACVVTIRDIARGRERSTGENVWVKRPGTGEIKAGAFRAMSRQATRRALRKNEQLRWSDFE